MIAQSTRPGWFFVTSKGWEIGTSENLKSYLAKQQAGAAAAYQGTLDEVAKLRQQAEVDIRKAIDNASTEAQSVIASARSEAETILRLARATAEGVSLKDVQEQFKKAAGQCLVGVWVWTGLSISSIALFIIVVIAFLTRWVPSAQSDNNMNSGLVIYTPFSASPY